MWPAIINAGGSILKWGTALFAADAVVRGATNEGLVEHAADTISDHIVQPVLEGVAESGVDAEAHASGQNLISWANMIETIPFLGSSQFGQMIANFFRNWGEGYQNSNTENDGTTVKSVADNVDLKGDFLSSVTVGASVGSVIGLAVPIPVVGMGIGAAGGAVVGGLDHITGGYLASAFKGAAELVGLRDAPAPTPTPANTYKP